MARYWVGSTVASKIPGKFYFGTFVVNITACILIGFSLTYLGKRAGLSPAWRFLIPVGFIGAYSTFSTYEWEAFVSLKGGEVFLAALYAFSSLLLGLGAVWCGARLAGFFS
jgi:CrcB protein